ncbi:MAG: class C beta-lactamase-related serine hydrolase [Chloroflexota bacterium]|nr:MAG: class C beta-lactamase-related serine hydrolase [Chloroflexota bacterium]
MDATRTALFTLASPESRGIRSSAILAFLDAAERQVQHLHSLILLRRGALVAEGYWEPYGPEYRHTMYSLSKSFTSTAIGLLVAEGRLSVDDHVLSFLPDEAPAQPSANLRAMRVRDLLTMTTGHDADTTRNLRNGDASWVTAFLAEPVAHKPGTHFVYNSGASYMLSAIAQRLTGQRLLEYLQPRLFAPLGIEKPTWEASPEEIDAGGWGLNITTRDIARFGLLYQQGGVWQGQRLLPEAWVNEATARHVPNGPSSNPDWEQGYGYQFWRCRHGAYRGDGAFGQLCVVFPRQEAVLAITAGTLTMQLVLDLAWEHLLPAMGANSLPEDRAGQSALATRLASLRLPTVAGQCRAAVATEVSGKTYCLDANESGFDAMSFDFREDGATITIRNAAGEQPVVCGFGVWTRGEASLDRPRLGTDLARPERVAASGAWIDDRTYVAQICWYETPYLQTLTCRFDGADIAIERRVNVSFGPLILPTLTGRAAARIARQPTAD